MNLLLLWTGGGSGLPYTPPLDAQSAVAAYSTRKIRTAHAGACMNIRRSSDGATQDIGFASDGSLDAAAISTFVGANSAYVVTWYDQSGNGRDATQSTTASQPRIVNAGTLQIVGGNNRATIYFDGSTKMASGSFTAFASGFTLLTTAGVNANTSFNALVTKNPTGVRPNPWDIYSASYYLGDGATNTARSLTSQAFNAAGGFSQWSFAASASAVGAWRNGSSNVSSTAAPTAYGDTNAPIVLGSRGDGVTTLNGWISEVIITDSFLASTPRQTIETNQSAYF